MLYEQPDDLSNGEREILLLKATMESINNMVNYGVFKFHHKDPDSSVLFLTNIHQQYFIIVLTDFLSLETFESRKADLFKQLQRVCKNPCYNVNTKGLETATNGFRDWLEQDVEFEHDGDTRKLWFPSIDQEIALKITRLDFIRICGNISKHNPLGLNRQAAAIRNIFENNNINISLTEALLIMDEFYEQFHNDLFIYHSSTIAEFLNNLRWAIYEYLQPLFKKSTEHYWDDALRLQSYRYHYPEGINNEYIKTIFWNLMNDVRSKPYIPRFKVTRHLKMYY
jgi:hypothetical protein